MSLISDALKKAQQEREILQEDDLESPPPPKYSKLYSNKRLVVYGLLTVILVLAVILVTVVFSPDKDPGMKALNVRENSQPAAGGTGIKKKGTLPKEEKSTLPVPVTAEKGETTASEPLTRQEKQEAAPTTLPSQGEGVASGSAAPQSRGEKEGITSTPPTAEPEKGAEPREVKPAETDAGRKAPALYVKRTAWEEIPGDRLKFAVILSGQVEYRVLPLDETPGRLAVDLLNIRAEKIHQPVNRLNVKVFRGSYNTPEVFRLVFELLYLLDYNVSLKNNILTIEFSGRKEVVGKLQEPGQSTPGAASERSNIKEDAKKDISTKEKPTGKIQKVIETGESSAEVSIEALIRQGDDLMAENNFLTAVEKYKAALQQKKSPELYVKLYGAFKALENSVLARAYVEDGIKYFPGDFYLNKIAAILYIRSQEFGKARENIKKALEINAGDYTLYTYLGLCYFHGKEYQDAFGNFKKSLELNSDAVENYYYIGLIFDNRKEYRKALEYYNVFLKLNPDSQNFKHREWIIRRIRELREYLEQQ